MPEDAIAICHGGELLEHITLDTIVEENRCTFGCHFRRQAEGERKDRERQTRDFMQKSLARQTGANKQSPVIGAGRVDLTVLCKCVVDG